ncbi:MAG: hypothetical protein M3N98_05035 [Actinomycetota bacterium]|nr:hypothetical protein [Actinomycetota bacterium]
MTWAVVLYPAWDDWSESDPTVRDAIQAWFESWIASGPPPDAEQVDRLIGVVGTDLRYFKVVHPSAGVTVTYVVGRANERDYVALLEIRSRPRRRSPPPI